MTISQMKIEIGELIRNSVVRNFVEGGRPEKWTPSQRALGLIRSRIDGKRRVGKTLIDTAKLMNSINYKISGDNIFVGTAISYGKYVDSDRKFLMLQKNDKTRIMNLLETTIKSILGV